MKYLLKGTFFLAVLLLSFGCGEDSSGNSSGNDSDSTEQKSTANENQVAPEPIPGLSLNDGKRWQANVETTQGINNMIRLMNGTSHDENAIAYLALRDSLVVEYDGIFRKCTMEGAAHDQLHKYLIPVYTLLLGLISNDANIRQETYFKLEGHLKQYSDFFE